MITTIYSDIIPGDDEWLPAEIDQIKKYRGNLIIAERGTETPVWVVLDGRESYKFETLERAENFLDIHVESN